MNRLPKYQSIILDVDGVIFDSNALKEHNIREVASQHLAGERLIDFIHYFIGSNGIPRETKIAAFFGASSIEYDQVLGAYNQLNSQTLYSASLTRGALAFLEKYNSRAIWAVSGGAENEVKELFRRNDLTRFFKGIHGGPVSKKEHLQKIAPESPILYVGDSRVDYETARHIGADFCFMSGYTQFAGWKNYFNDLPEVRIINGLTEL